MVPRSAKRKAAAPINHTACLRCRTQFRAPDVHRVVHVCDRCFGELMRYITSAKSPEQVHARLAATHRLYVLPTTDPEAWRDHVDA